MYKYLIIGLMLSSFPFAQASAQPICKQTANLVDTLICNDSYLGRLDDLVKQQLYVAKSISPAPQVLQNSQQQWLEERNHCNNSRCLQQAYMTRLQALAKTVERGTCHIDDKRLVGTWVKQKGGTSFEKFAFQQDKDIQQFNSWLHNKPDIDGAWEINGCAISISNPLNDTASFELEIVRLEPNQLYVLDKATHYLGLYKRQP